MTRQSNPVYRLQRDVARIKPFPTLKVALLAAAIAFTSGCLYRQDVQQGNEITREMVNQIEPGMSKREVVKILGYPLINDPFNRDRWDYYYSLKEGLSKTPTQQSVTLQFNGEILDTIQTNLPEKIPETGGEQDSQEEDTGGGY